MSSADNSTLPEEVAGVDLSVGNGQTTASASPANDGQVANAASPELPTAGLGVDIVEIERIEQILEQTPRFRWRVFSEIERSYAEGKARPAVHFALFFAAKEAVLKSLGTGFAGMAFTDVEVDHDRYGRPFPLLHGHAQELAQAQGIVELQLSLSYTHTVAVASAVAIKEQDRPRHDEKVDPKAELARQFKEMRAMLDDMDERLKGLDDDDAHAQNLPDVQGNADAQDIPDVQGNAPND